MSKMKIGAFHFVKCVPTVVYGLCKSLAVLHERDKGSFTMQILR